ncbi:MAG: hypothetical protein HYZ45_05865 [Burkholderiales bacterium]|nr:hypothetical protein [Burkholderiales bacterium]
MGLSQISSANSSSSLSFQTLQSEKAIRTQREEASKLGKSFTGRSKAEEDKAAQAASQAAGVGSGTPQLTRVEAANKTDKASESGNFGNGINGATRTSAAKSTDQAVKAIAARGGDETSFKVQQQRADRIAGEIQKDQQTRQLQTAAYQRSDQAALQVQRTKLNEQFEAAKQQNVQVKQVEKVDPRLVAAKVQNEQVQRIQESAQTERYAKVAALQVKTEVADNAAKLKEAQKEPSEATKARNQAERPSPVGQRINVKA